MPRKSLPKSFSTADGHLSPLRIYVDGRAHNVPILCAPETVSYVRASHLKILEQTLDSLPPPYKRAIRTRGIRILLNISPGRKIADLVNMAYARPGSRLVDIDPRLLTSNGLKGIQHLLQEEIIHVAAGLMRFDSSSTWRTAAQADMQGENPERDKILGNLRLFAAFHDAQMEKAPLSEYPASHRVREFLADVLNAAWMMAQTDPAGAEEALQKAFPKSLGPARAFEQTMG